MDDTIKDKFQRMGARVEMTVMGSAMSRRGRRRAGRRMNPNQPIQINVLRDRAGEYFDLLCQPAVDVQVLDVRPADRHLLLLVRQPVVGGEAVKSRFLCGHDERSWFVAAVPESAAASSVQAAKDALKPSAVWQAIERSGMPRRHRDRRRTPAFIRQGEWFFIPRPRMAVDEKQVLRHEPIRRGAGKPHMCEFLYRAGGETVYVNARYPNGLSMASYRSLGEDQRRRQNWRVMVRDARVYARGAIRHPDHKTIWLDGWHEVVMNTETQARAMRQVAFLD